MPDGCQKKGLNNLDTEKETKTKSPDQADALGCGGWGQRGGLVSRKDSAEDLGSCS